MLPSRCSAGSGLVTTLAPVGPRTGESSETTSGPRGRCGPPKGVEDVEASTGGGGRWRSSWRGVRALK